MDVHDDDFSAEAARTPCLREDPLGRARNSVDQDVHGPRRWEGEPVRAIRVREERDSDPAHPDDEDPTRLGRRSGGARRPNPRLVQRVDRRPDPPHAAVNRVVGRGRAYVPAGPADRRGELAGRVEERVARSCAGSDRRLYMAESDVRSADDRGDRGEERPEVVAAAAKGGAGDRRVDQEVAGRRQVDCREWAGLRRALAARQAGGERGWRREPERGSGEECNPFRGHDRASSKRCLASASPSGTRVG